MQVLGTAILYAATLKERCGRSLRKVHCDELPDLSAELAALPRSEYLPAQHEQQLRVPLPAAGLRPPENATEASHLL